MKRILQFGLIGFCALIAITAWADEKKKDDDKKKKKPVPVTVYLGNSDITGGTIKKSKFDELVKQGLTSRDSTGRVFEVESFFMTFCERMIYEDSVGNLMPVTDYLSEYCFDNKLKDYQERVLIERTKHGDTVIFEDIHLISADSLKAGAKGTPIRLVISEK